MKSIISIAQVYGRLFSEDRQIIPMEYKTVQKYLKYPLLDISVYSPFFN